MTSVYVLTDPRTHDVRYVGVTKRTLSRRLRGHVTEARNSSSKVSHRLNWIRQLKRLGQEPVISHLQDVNDDAWQDAERYWISYFKSVGCDLVNGDSGGTGWVEATEEMRTGCRKRNLNRKRTEESKHRQSQSMKSAWQDLSLRKKFLSRTPVTTKGRETRRVNTSAQWANLSDEQRQARVLKSLRARYGDSYTPGPRSRVLRVE